MFLLVRAYPGCPGSKAVKWSLLLFVVPAHPGSPGKRAVKRVCVCVRVCKMILASFVEPVVVVVVHRSCHTKVADLDRLSRVNETVATRQITTEYSSVVFTLILQWHSIIM